MICNDDIIDRREVFFGCGEIKTLPERFKNSTIFINFQTN